MGAFDFVALDASGKEKKGVLEGDTARQVRQQLRDKGWIALEVDEARQSSRKSGKTSSTKPRLARQRGVSATDLALITRQMATLSRSGMPLEETLQAVAQQSEKQHITSMMLAVRSRVMEGHTLANGLADFPHVFPSLYRTTVAAGEQSAHLDLVLERLADYSESRQQMQQKIQLALFYPATLTFVALAVVIGLLTYVVPQVVQVFDNIGQELPWLTQALISISDFMIEYGLWILAALVVGVILLIRLLKQDGPKRKYHQMLLHLPVIGRLERGVNAARFSRTFSIVTASGVPVLEGLQIASQVMSNLPMKEAVEEAIRKVREGASIHGALEKSGYFPPMTVHMIASGEASGQLEEMLERAAINQEREIETMISAIMGMFEPVLILVMGAVVLIIVLAILLPIFDLNQLVN
ncbi:MAG: type II secretion system inner membrane protein GspF [Gammaproteobacteria bacterium]